MGHWGAIWMIEKYHEKKEGVGGGGRENKWNLEYVCL